MLPKLLPTLLPKLWLWVSENTIPYPCLPRNHFCHLSGNHLFLQVLLLTKSKSKDLGHFPMLSPSLSSHFGHSFASPPPARNKAGSLLLPAFGISLALSSSYLPLTEQAWPPCSTCLRDGDTSVPLSSVINWSCFNTTSTSVCGFPSQSFRELLCYHPTLFSQLPLCL